ncbi:hypothetical protein EQG49_11870 [Periweissella cryptocerci]|uniref:Uncharacterized protein n=1 Tax=Periweissella cryptocerci TaxID=2506420 RepID=A0A4P6YWD6_9LACO|nr:hypothetical protein [Periweissella cryptocerci]QBO37101.1 hypothetical protein EQG49_11870 [Periweissella cryptocerci]
MPIANYLDLSQLYAKTDLVSRFARVLDDGDYVVFQDDEIKFFNKGQAKSVVVNMDEVARTAHELVYVVHECTPKLSKIDDIMAQCALIKDNIAKLEENITKIEKGTNTCVTQDNRITREKCLAEIGQQLENQLAMIVKQETKLKQQNELSAVLTQQIEQINTEKERQEVDAQAENNILKQGNHDFHGVPQLGDYYGGEENPLPAGEWGWIEPRDAKPKNAAKLLVRTTEVVRGEQAATIARWNSINDSFSSGDEDIDETEDEWIVFGIEIYPINVKRKLAEKVASDINFWRAATIDEDIEYERYLYLLISENMESKLIHATKTQTSMNLLMMAQVGINDAVRVGITDKDFMPQWIEVRKAGE